MRDLFGKLDLDNTIRDYLHGKEKNASVLNAKKSAVKSFYDISGVEGLTAEAFETTLNTQGTKNLSAVIGFLRYLYETGEISDPRLKRLCDNASAFGSHTPLDFVGALLNSPDYDKAVEQDMLSSHEGRMAFLSAYKGTEGIPLRDDVREACNGLIRTFAFDSERSLRKRLDSIREILDLASSLLVTMQEEVTAKSVAAVLADPEKVPDRLDRTGKMIGSFAAVLGEMDSRGTIADPSLIHFVRVLYPKMSAPAKSGTATSRPMEDYIAVLMSDRIDKWEVLYPPRYKNQLLIYVDVEHSELRNALTAYLEENCTSITAKWKKVAEDFTKSAGGNLPEYPKDLTYDLWLRQEKYFAENEPEGTENLPSGVLNGFYLYVWMHYNAELFSEASISPRLLKRNDIGTLMKKGYEIIPYSRMDPVPMEDKWLLWFGGSERTNSDKKLNGSMIFDFEEVKYPLYRYWVKSYLWTHSPGLTTRIQKVRYLIEFLNFLYELKTVGSMKIFNNNAVHFFKRDEMDDIDGVECIAYKEYVLDTYSLNNAADYIYALTNFIAYLKRENLCTVTDEYMSILSVTKDRKNNANALTDDETRQLYAELARMKKESLHNHIAYYAIVLLLKTDLRITQILGLETDCIVNSPVPNERYLNLKRKTGNGDEEPIPYPESVIYAVEAALALTESLREETPDEILRKNVFIVPDKRFRGHAARLTEANINDLLKRACRLRRLKQTYTCENIRDTRMNKVDLYSIDKDLSELERSIHTGHATSITDIKHYRDLKMFRRNMESVYGIVIGDIDEEIFPLNGTVVKAVGKRIAKDENAVRNGTGWCGDCKCTAPGLVDCLICRKFMTDVTKKPEFMMAIADTDEAIGKAKNQHQKEDLILVKTLLVMYLEKIMLIDKEEKEKVNGRYGSTE